MLKHIRLATEDEVKELATKSDLEAPYTVLALDGYASKPDFAVIRQVIELDPVYFAPECNNNEKARFVWGLEERLQGAGIKTYYFNVSVDDAQWQKIILNWGAERVSPGMEYRFKKRLA